MVCAYAKYTGKLGVFGDFGPGRHTSAEWFVRRQTRWAAVLAITGMQFHDLIGTYTQPEVALDKVP
jgi:pyruvate dehydrogenase (quinone)